MHCYCDQVLWSGWPPPLETDCGTWCSAFTYLNEDLPLVPLAYPGFYSSVGFVYEAAPEVCRCNVNVTVV